MRKTLLGIDLAICSLWTIAALGSRIAWSLLLQHGL